jgi:hypothetical protein
LTTICLPQSESSAPENHSRLSLGIAISES